MTNVVVGSIGQCITQAVAFANGTQLELRNIVVQFDTSAPMDQLRREFAIVQRDYSGMMVLDCSSKDFRHLHVTNTTVPLVVVVRCDKPLPASHFHTVHAHVLPEPDGETDGELYTMKQIEEAFDSALNKVVVPMLESLKNTSKAASI
jgi:hypothetical protein